MAKDVKDMSMDETDMAVAAVLAHQHESYKTLKKALGEFVRSVTEVQGLLHEIAHVLLNEGLEGRAFEIEDCPFCRSENVGMTQIEGLEDKPIYQLYCKNCMARSPSGMTPEDAVTSWNKMSAAISED